MSGHGSQLTIEASGHVVQFYGSDEELAGSVSDYLEAGLRAGESALVVATTEHLVRFLSRLTGSGLDAAALESSGRLVAADAAETLASFTGAEGIDPERFESVARGLIGRATAAGQPVRIYGEMVALLWDAGRVPLALELEGLWNHLSSQLPFSLLCGYPARLLDEKSAAVEEVCRLHAAVVDSRPGATAGWAPVPGGQRRFGQSRTAPGEARRFVTSTLASIAHDPMLAIDAAIVVSELAANAVLHAQSEFTVAVSRWAGGIRISVVDTSPLPTVHGSIPLPARDGHGLGVIDKLASSWSAEPHPDGKIVWADLPQSPHDVR